MSEPSSYLYHPRNIIDEVQTGDGLTWAEEFQFLWQYRWVRLIDLMQSVRENGIREPIVIGDDGRLWDGHHRMAVAIALQLGPIEVLDHRKTEETP
ncbi:UNVERIFIED_ORG: hypothetical protein M2328_005767 [Rhodococcus erythropolis]